MPETEVKVTQERRRAILSNLTKRKIQQLNKENYKKVKLLQNPSKSEVQQLEQFINAPCGKTWIILRALYLHFRYSRMN